MNSPKHDKELLDAVMDFASLSPVRTATEVYALLDPFGIGGKVARLKEADIEAAAIFEAERLRLIEMLTLIETDLDKARLKLRTKVNRLVIEKRAFILPTVATDGELRWQLYGVEAAIYLALALLLDSTRKYGRRVHHCGRVGCPKWKVETHDRGGRRTKGGQRWGARYCSREHQKEQDNINAPKRMSKKSTDTRRKTRRGG